MQAPAVWCTILTTNGGNDMNKYSKLSGSVDRLTNAMRDVYYAEVVEGAVEPIGNEITTLRDELKEIRTIIY